MADLTTKKEPKVYRIKTFNNISHEGLKLLPANFIAGPDIEDPDAILVRSADLHDYEFTKNVRFIGRAGAGVNNIPVDRCSEKGIVVSKAPGANANGVKELVLTALLLSSRDVIGGIDWVRNYKKDDIAKAVESNKKRFAGPELMGKTLGVIGLGATGRRVAKMGIDMGMDVYGYDPFLSIGNALHLDTRVNVLEDPKDVFTRADYVTLHIPYTKDTKNFVGDELLSVAKPNMRLINIARGGLVDLEALKKYIDAGIVARYIVDFPDPDTVRLPNTINIPHLGASTPESEENSAKMVVRQLVDYLDNGNIRHSVNFPDSNMGACKSMARITVNHRNIPNMIGQITAVLADAHINIANLLNRHRVDWAYTMIDVDSPVDESLRERLLAIDGVVRVRFM
ncbi:MAG: phosphoglycerate dehydrogenase [Peptoniphilus sp.]|nr:phosphoglycerate dehydrogenase [Peptoniphilus sp.]MDD7363292.1 phosphoglycerate dehydrogenase [Bacillota bacterium]MDY6045387.1 phosphoglycerate dehydrogenase [Peptoniphilus sp.]